MEYIVLGQGKRLSTQATGHGIFGMGRGVLYTVLRWMASTGLEFDLLGSFRMTWDMTSSGNKALVRFTESYLGSTKTMSNIHMLLYP
jgi:hypothetical protein